MKKDIKLYNREEMKEAFMAGRNFEAANPDTWKDVFDAGERRGSGFLNEAVNAPNWIQFMGMKKKTLPLSFTDWEKRNGKRIGILIDKDHFLTAAIEADIIKKTKKKPITIAAIEEVVSPMFNISINDLRYNKTRKKEIMRPRHIGYYLGYFHAHTSLSSIGHKFGGRDHACVINGAKKMAGYASSPGPDRENLKEAYSRLLENGYAVDLFIQDDKTYRWSGANRTVVKRVELNS